MFYLYSRSVKGRLRATIFKSAETVHLTFDIMYQYIHENCSKYNFTSHFTLTHLLLEKYHSDRKNGVVFFKIFQFVTKSCKVYESTSIDTIDKYRPEQTVAAVRNRVLWLHGPKIN